MTMRSRQDSRAIAKSSVRQSLGAMTIGLLLATSLMAASDHGVPAFDDLTTARAVATAPMPSPGYLEPVIDPAFRTPFTRVTDPGGTIKAGTSCGAAYCTHRYSSSQAWNADQSLLLIVNGCQGFCFLDGQTYRPLFRRSVPNECEWHPTIPSLMICVSGNEIYTWVPWSDTKTTVYVAAAYN
jgi:hypothetical protein